MQAKGDVVGGQYDGPVLGKAPGKARLHNVLGRVHVDSCQTSWQ